MSTHWQSWNVRMAMRKIGGDGSFSRNRYSAGSRRNNTVRSLMPSIVWFDGEIQAYMAPKLANAMANTGALLMTIGRRSVRKSRRKRLAELTPYERDFYAQGVVVDKNGKVKRTRDPRSNVDPKKFPMLPGEPGGPARYTPAGNLDFKHSIFFGYDPATRSVVVGPVLLAGSGAQRRLVPQLLEEGGMAPVSYGPNHGRMAYLAARPTMRLAFAKALPRIEKQFSTAATMSGGNATISVE